MATCDGNTSIPLDLALSSHQVLTGSLIISHLDLANYWDDKTMSELDQTRVKLFLPSRERIMSSRQPALAFPRQYYKQYSKNATQNTAERVKNYSGKFATIHHRRQRTEKILRRKEYELLYFSPSTGTNKNN